MQSLNRAFGWQLARRLGQRVGDSQRQLCRRLVPAEIAPQRCLATATASALVSLLNSSTACGSPFGLSRLSQRTFAAKLSLANTATSIFSEQVANTIKVCIVLTTVYSFQRDIYLIILAVAFLSHLSAASASER